MTKDEKQKEELALLTMHGEDTEVHEVNPAVFANRSFLITVDPEQKNKNDKFDQAFKLEVYDRAIQNPYVDQEAITRDFLLEQLIKGEATKYMKQNMGALGSLLPQNPQQPGQPPQAGQPQGAGTPMTQRVMQSAAMQPVGA